MKSRSELSIEDEARGSCEGEPASSPSDSCDRSQEAVCGRPDQRQLPGVCASHRMDV